jgi:hypothetical protein
MDVKLKPLFWAIVGSICLWGLIVFAVVLIAMAITGCTAAPVAPKQPVALLAHVISPADPLAYCGHEGAYVAALKPIRTAKQLADYTNRLETSREKLLTSLQNCDEKRAKLFDMVQHDVAR